MPCKCRGAEKTETTNAIKICHASDTHLGRPRLDGRLPDQDLAGAFGFIVDRAIEDKADDNLLFLMRPAFDAGGVLC